MMTEEELVEALANKEHDSWARWMSWVFQVCPPRADGCVIITADFVERWQRQIATPYANLTEREKQSDRDEVAHILPIIRQFAAGKSEERP